MFCLSDLLSTLPGRTKTSHRINSGLQISVDALVPELINGNQVHYTAAIGLCATLLDDCRITDRPFHLHISTIKSRINICTLLFEFTMDSNANRAELIQYLQPATRKLDLLGAHITVSSLGEGKHQIHIETNVVAKFPSATMSLPSWLYGRPALLLNDNGGKAASQTKGVLEQAGARVVNLEWCGEETVQSLIQKYTDRLFNMVCVVDFSNEAADSHEAIKTIQKFCDSGLMSSPAELLILVSQRIFDCIPTRLLNIAGYKIIKSPLTMHRLINPKGTLMQSNIVRMSKQTSEICKPLEVLLVDDCALTRRLVKNYFNDKGLGIIESGTAKTAIEISQKKRFDAVLLDLDLPDMTGYDLAKIIKSDTSNNRSPIIAITASRDIRDYQKCFDHGMADCVGKPLHFTDLMNRIKGWLSVNDTPNSVSIA